MPTDTMLSRSEMTAKLAQARANTSVRALAKTLGVPHTTIQGWLTLRHLPQDALRKDWDRLITTLSLDKEMSLETWWESISILRKGPRPSSPYQGLQPYSSSDASLFFGRTDLVRTLEKRIDTFDHSGPVLLIGPSGSGKTSLLNAGLAYRPSTRVDLSRSADLPPHPDQLTIIDHGERIFTDHAAHEAGIRRWIEEQAKQAPVVVALRADFYADAMRIPEWCSALAHPVIMSAISATELKEIIIGPAKACGIDVGKPVAALIQRDVAAAFNDELPASSLPYVSAALYSAFQQSDGKVITSEDYVATGGLGRIIATIAEDAWSQIPSEYHDGTKKFLLSLLTVSDTAVVRSAPRKVDAPTDVVDQLREARLITSDSDGYRITHDLVLEAWPRLRSWVEDEEAVLQHYSTLRAAAQTWQENERDPGFLIPLHERSTTLITPDNVALTNHEQEFATACSQHFAAQKEQARKRARKMRVLNRTIAILGSLAIVFALGTVYMWRQAADSAEHSAVTAAEALSRQLAQESVGATASDPVAGSLIALTAEQERSTTHSHSALTFLTEQHSPMTVRGTPGSTMISSDGPVLARGDSTGQLTVWKQGLSGEAQSLPVGPEKKSIFVVKAFRSTGKQWVAVGGWEFKALVDADTMKVAWLQPEPTVGHPTVALTTDNKQVIFGDSQGKIESYDLASGTLSVVAKADMRVMGVATTPGCIAAAGQKPVLERWCLVGGSYVAQPSLPLPTRGTSIAANPTGTQVAVALHSGAVARFAMQGTAATPLPILTDVKAYPHCVSYSDSGKIALATADKEVAIYEGESVIRRFPLPGIVTSVGWRGETPIAAAVDGGVRVWEGPSPIITKRNEQVFQVSTSDDGSVISALFKSETVELRRGPNWDRIAIPALDNVKTNVAELAPDGKHLVASSREKTMLFAIDGNQARLVHEIPSTGPAMFTRFKPHTQELLLTTSTRLSHLAIVNNKLVERSSVDCDYPFAATFAAGTDTVVVGWASGKADVRKAGALGTSIASIPEVKALPTNIHPLPHSPGVLIGTEDGTLLVVDVAQPGRPVVKARVDKLGSTVATATQSPDGKLISIGLVDGTILTWAWNGSALTPIQRIPHPGVQIPEVRYINNTTIAFGTTGGHVGTAIIDRPAAIKHLCTFARNDAVVVTWEHIAPGYQPRRPCR